MLFKVAGAVLLLMTVSVLVWLYNPIPPGPSAVELARGADRYQVEIARDPWAVPHIKGVTDADVSFGLAYAHAEDDFETIQETVAATRGVLARYRGRKSVATDYVVALMDVWKVLGTRYQDDVPEDVKAIADAYAQGINLYAAHYPNSVWHGLAPFTGQDVIAGFMFKTPFFYGLDKTLLSLLDKNRQPEIALAPSGEHGAWRISSTGSPELGSNAMAVAPTRSGDGKTRLLINSHQPMAGPVAWYEAHLISAEGWDMTGGVFPGTPVILHGFNKYLGWANTVNHIDLVDWYVLERNPVNAMQYKLDGEWRDFEQQEVTLFIKLFGPFQYPAKRRILRSRHGPVIESQDHSYAIRYAGMNEIRQLEQYYRLNRSESLEDFMQVMRMNALPSINYVYADKVGNIAFIHNAQYPRRMNGWDWSKDLPGNRADLIWQGYRDFDDAPKLVNPVSGMVFNANNTPFVATDGPDNLRQEDFPSSMGLATNHTNRSLRFIELNDGQQVLGKKQILQQKFDTKYSTDSEHVATLEKVVTLDVRGDTKLEHAQKHLRVWDRDTDIENRHTALAITVLRNIKNAEVPNDHSPAALRGALQGAVDYLTRHYGRIDPTWGEVNRLVRGDVDLPISGGPDVLRAIYSYGHSPNETPKATHGDTWMALVEWSPDGTQSAQVMHQFGSATQDKKSVHYADQAPMFVKQQWRPVTSGWHNILAKAKRVYRPQDNN